MSETLPGIPKSFASLALADSALHVEVDAAIYPLDAVYGACFTMIDRCYVLIDQPSPERYRVVLSTKKPGADPEALRALAGELSNELLSCAYRARLLVENRATIEAVTMQAIGGAMGPPALDDLEAFDFSEEPFDDPLGIAMSWEEKYGEDKQARKKGEEEEEP